MFAAAVFEVLQNSALKLKNLLEALALHVRPGFFAADAAGAKHHDRLLLEFVGQLTNGRGEVAEMVDPERRRRF